MAITGAMVAGRLRYQYSEEVSTYLQCDREVINWLPMASVSPEVIETDYDYIKWKRSMILCNDGLLR